MSLYKNSGKNASSEAPDAEPVPAEEPLTLLLVDDEDNVLNSLRRIFMNENYTILTANSAAKALEIMENRQVHLIISDHRMPGMTGAELLKSVREKYPETIRIMLTGFADVNSIMGAIMDGAVYRFITKPWNDEELRLTVSLALQQYVLMRENRELKDIVRKQQEHFRERYSFHTIVTQSPVMRQALELTARVTASPKTTISLSGESGAGKEVLARAIHFESGCLSNSFVAVNCAAIPEALLESELFGHVRGAFTGAERDREGKFSLARGGTVLLDEIGDMPLPLQAKLLRVLEERTYEKVGANTPLPADFRVIVATHQNLAEMVRQGKFREDLFHRINVVPIAIPSLRERREDIPLLVDLFLGIFRQHQGKALPGVSKKAMDLITSYSWPGNVRELRNVVEYAAIMVSDELIRPEHLRIPAAQPLTVTVDTTTVDFHVTLSPDELSLDSITARILDMALQRCNGNKSQAAALLKVNRKMFYR